MKKSNLKRGRARERKKEREKERKREGKKERKRGTNTKGEEPSYLTSAPEEAREMTVVTSRARAAVA